MTIIRSIIVYVMCDIMYLSLKYNFQQILYAFKELFMHTRI